jgi:tetratricopeptide (TPR) repeat protein
LLSQYQLHRNLGWVYLERKRYDKAEEYLNQAIEFDKQIPKGSFGKGIANCFKAKMYEFQEKPDKAANQWKLCLEFGKPETLFEYQTIVKMNPDVGSKLDTTGVFK